MAKVYLLYSEKDQRTYVGSTLDLKKRLFQRNTGLVQSTKNRRPLRLVFFEEYGTIADARRREHYFKSGAGRRRLKSIYKKLIPHSGIVSPHHCEVRGKNGRTPLTASRL